VEWPPPDIRSEVTYFKETTKATFAHVRVSNPEGLPVVYEREFVFVKNRFLATREIVTFEKASRLALRRCGIPTTSVRKLAATGPTLSFTRR